MAMTITPRTRIILIVVFVILLIAILIYVFWPKKSKGETCPNGKAIPEDGDCSRVMTKAEIDAYHKAQALLLGTAGGGGGSGTGNTSGGSGGNGVPFDSSTICRQPLSYTNESFPLAYGMKGPNVKLIQKYVKVKEDGYFGCITRSAVQKEWNTDTVDQGTFDQAIGVLANQGNVG